MESENFNKWLLSDLKQLLLQYNISDSDIKGTGKNGNVIKKDYVNTISKLDKSLPKYNEPITQHINEDIWFNIMLNLNDQDLKKTCFTDKMALKVCNNISFWKIKFQNEDLEIVGKMPVTLKEWIKRYKIASNASDIANKIVNLLKYDNQYTIETYIHLDFNMLKIIPEYQDQIKKIRSRFVGNFEMIQGFSIKYKNGIQFKFFYIINWGDTAGKFTITITYDQLFLILYRYLHYLNAIDLTDQFGFSYDLKDDLTKINPNSKDFDDKYHIKDFGDKYGKKLINHLKQKIQLLQ